MTTLTDAKPLVTLNDADLDHISGGWDTGAGVVTATLKGGTPPPVYSIISNKADVTVALGNFTAPGFPP